MLLLVSINGHRLVALVDSGSTTNFMLVGLMSRLQLPSTPHPTIKVQVANGLEQGVHVVSDDVLMLQQMVQPRRVQK